MHLDSKRAQDSGQRSHALWTVVEQCGQTLSSIAIGRETRPAYDLPQMDDFDVRHWCAPSTFEWTVRIHGQDIMENSVDSAHFAAVHGHKMPVNTFTAEGRELRISQATEVNKLGFDIKTKLEFYMIRAGFSLFAIFAIRRAPKPWCFRPSSPSTPNA